jgi:hypothetical protein
MPICASPLIFKLRHYPKFERVFGGENFMPVPSPILIADKCTPTFSAEADGKIRVVYQGWDDPKIVLPSQSIEIRRVPQGVEFRIAPAARWAESPRPG